MILNPKIDKIKLTDIIGLDLETSGLNPNKDIVLLLVLTTFHETFVLEVGKYTKDSIKSLILRLNTLKTVIAHNAKFDASFLFGNYGVLLTNWFDTMLASQVIDNGKIGMRHNLPATVKRYLGLTLNDSEDKKKNQLSFVGLSYEQVLTQKQIEYAAEDTKYLIPLCKAQCELINKYKLDKIIKLECKLLPVLVKIEVIGCLIDKNSWLSEIKKWKASIYIIYNKLDNILNKLSIKYTKLKKYSTNYTTYDIFGNSNIIRNINYNSQDQIINLILDIGEVPIISKKTSNYSVDDEHLIKFIHENPTSPLKEFLTTLKEVRELSKLISTYGESFLALLDDNNYIHTNYTQCRTATGRLSSTHPNLQNIPGGRKLGGKLREFFICKPGYVMCTSDMNSAEVYIAADYSQDQLLLDSILEGADMHSKLASVSFSIIFDKPFTVKDSEEHVEVGDYTFKYKELRTAHKSVLFAKFYKAGANRILTVLAPYINLFHKESERKAVAQKISNALDKELPSLTKYLTSIIESAQKHGVLVGSKLGRIRHFPDPDKVYGNAANMPIQNTNGEAMKIALIKADEYLERTGYGRIVLTVHDELVAELKESVAEEAGKEIQKIMADSLSYFLTSIKGGASFKIKSHWEK